MSPRLYDAHNHLQDDRFGGRQEEILAACAREGVVRMVVNGSAEADWPQVLALARAHPAVSPSFGYHPWYVHERTRDWQATLVHYLEQVPSAIGETGLDRWKSGLAYDGQEEVFVAQLHLAAEHDRPLSIHCLQAWGRLHELLVENPRPRCGFLLHSYGGSRELVEPLARLGAYFSLPGYFAHERKTRQRDVFRHIPRDRLLIETDAPDQSLPATHLQYPLAHPATGQPLNHPANLAAVYRFAADLLGEPLDALARRVEENFARLFGGVAAALTSTPGSRD